ncbi:TraB/GumN family protein (plasmid) [Burkholderia cenocepacia]|uniref:TraB/GumN family protein n=1 Tax=Burkholderia cepacia complex TaxID=87882 RepID=UPI001BA731B4|nr:MULTISPECIES: TraB/GumN family protein [Burkholderia cepacia complex]MDN7926922.1 TraB/GumN family protein [Burkholderia vietnamiensis]QUN41392.1 TraB/GumN family protein [Burkholderia cenocepacia]QUO30732.1 TraB/GumN family protein [Burkholderia cenocepacia]
MTIRARAFALAIAALSIVSGATALSADVRASENGVPALEVISPSGGRSILLGTLHVADPKLRQPDPRVLDGVRQLVLEHPDKAPAANARGKDGPSGRRSAWSASVSADQVAQLRAHLQCRYPELDNNTVDQVLSMVMNYPTQAAAIQLAYDTCDAAGYRSRDDIIGKAATERKLPIRYLETDEEINRLRLQLPGDNARQSFAAALSPEAARLKARVVDALNRGDFAGVATATNQSLVLAGDDPNQFNAIMVKHRNEQWMKKLPALLTQGGSLVLVGAGHLPGPDGLIGDLRSHGFSVNPIELPAGSGH